MKFKIDLFGKIVSKFVGITDKCTVFLCRPTYILAETDMNSLCDYGQRSELRWNTRCVIFSFCTKYFCGSIGRSSPLY